MENLAETASRERLTERLLFFAVLLACCWFFSVGSWNQNARFDPIFAFWENEGPARFTFMIDRYIVFPEFGVNTGDWSRCEGHYYSNKSPGTTVLGVLAYGPLYLLERCFVKGDFAPGLDLLNAWILNLLLSGLPLAFGAVFFRRILLRYGCSAGSSGFACFCFRSVSSRLRRALFSACSASNGPTTAEMMIKIQYQGIWILLPAGDHKERERSFCFPLPDVSVNRFSRTAFYSGLMRARISSSTVTVSSASSLRAAGKGSSPISSFPATASSRTIPCA